MKIGFVSSTGGHLVQLVALRPWYEQHDRFWVVLDRGDTRSMLPGERIISHHYPISRNVLNALRNIALAVRVLRRERPDVLVSTGAAIAVSFYVVARLMRIPTVYIEVFDRIDSGTISGRLCYRLGSRFLLQWDEQRSVYPRATVVGPLLPSPALADHADVPDDGNPPPAIVVTVGTDAHQFDRVLRWTSQWMQSRGFTGPVFAQSGTSTEFPKGITCSPFLAREELLRLFGRAKVVVSHGGPATICDAWQMGRIPVAVPRQAALGEHVDDHQVRFVRRLAQSGGVYLAQDEKAFDDALDAAVLQSTAPIDSAADLAEQERAVQAVGVQVSQAVGRGPEAR